MKKVFDYGTVMMRFELSYIVECYVSDAEDARLLEEVVFDRLYWDRFDDAAKKDRRRGGARDKWGISLRGIAKKCVNISTRFSYKAKKGQPHGCPLKISQSSVCSTAGSFFYSFNSKLRNLASLIT